MITSDFLVIGGGVIGLSIARELKKRNPKSSIIILEKEDSCGLHASGRNSGVLHAGFYYTADSLKAKFTKTGNQQLTEFCKSNNIAVNNCGKLVVAENPEDLPQLDELLLRGKNNNVVLHDITEKEAKELKSKLDKGADFGQLAKKFSICPSKKKGGDLGEFRRGQMVKAFDDVVFKKELLKVHGPIKTKFGYHLIKTLYRN